MKDQIIAAATEFYGPPENPDKDFYLPSYGAGLELELSQELLKAFEIETLTEPNYDRCYRMYLGSQTHIFSLMVSLVHPFVCLWGGRRRFGIDRVYTGMEGKLDKTETYIIKIIEKHGLVLVPAAVILEKTPFKFADWYESDGDFLIYHLLFATATSESYHIDDLREIVIDEECGPIRRYLRQWNRHSFQIEFGKEG